MCPFAKHMISNASMDTQAVALHNSHMRQLPWGTAAKNNYPAPACVTGMVNLGMVSNQAHTQIAHALTTWGIRMAPG